MSLSRRNSEEPADFLDEDGEPNKHPALKNFSRTTEQVKHVAGRALKYGAIAAAGGAAVIGGASVALGLTTAGGCAAAAATTFGLSIPICAAIAYFGGGAAVTSVASIAGTAAVYTGAVGAALGAVLGVSGASEAADAEEDKIIAKYDQAKARSDRLARLRDIRDRQEVAMHKQEDQMRGVNPNRGLPGGGRGAEGPAYS